MNIKGDFYDKQNKKKIIKIGYVASDELAAQTALLLTSEGVRSMLLDAPPGVGKTFLAKSSSKSSWGKLYLYPGSSWESPEDFYLIQILYQY